SVSERWRVVAALFVLSFTVSNAIASFGVFLPALADAFGWSRGAISLAFSLNLLLGGFSGFAAGAIADRHGPRAILLATIGIAASGPSTPGSARGMGVSAALADRRFWSLTAAWVLSGAVSLMISVHVVSYARDQGIALASASFALTAFGFGTTVGRLAFGPLS